MVEVYFFANCFIPAEKVVFLVVDLVIGYSDIFLEQSQCLPLFIALTSRFSDDQVFDVVAVFFLPVL